MRILLWHGYLLTGSGSNVYTANIAERWRAAGHDVLILCQEPHAAELGFVDRAGDFSKRNDSFTLDVCGAMAAPGRCSVLRPNIAGLLPVFVHDEYEGFEVKLFVDLSDAELSRYTEMNTAALTTAIEEFAPDVIITGHEVMGPAIARQACAPTCNEYVAKLHGSGLEYAVKLQERYRRHAIEGLGSAAVVVGGSEYMVAEAGAVAGGWEDRAAVVNPGCDVELFSPLERDPKARPLVGYVGKLIASKGVHNLIAALSLVRTQEVESVIVGYGGFEEGLRELAGSLAAGDLSSARKIADADDELLRHLARFLQDPPSSFLQRMRTVPIHFTGRLEHEALAELLPAMDVLVVPSIVPEAFGMVAAEAAASGVLPIVPDHSGIAEAGRAVEEAIGAPGLLTFDATDPISGISAAIDRVLSLPAGDRAEMGRLAADLARERWSWDRVAERLLALAPQRH